jgi:hypothetical protein
MCPLRHPPLTHPTTFLLQAAEGWEPLIPAEVLSSGADVRLPVPPPSQFVLEPWIATEPVRVGNAFPDVKGMGLGNHMDWQALSQCLLCC